MLRSYFGRGLPSLVLLAIACLFDQLAAQQKEPQSIPYPKLSTPRSVLPDAQA